MTIGLSLLYSPGLNIFALGDTMTSSPWSITKSYISIPLGQVRKVLLLKTEVPVLLPFKQSPMPKCWHRTYHKHL